MLLTDFRRGSFCGADAVKRRFLLGMMTFQAERENAGLGQFGYYFLFFGVMGFGELCGGGISLFFRC
jgi:hypothetical protein